MNHRDHDATRAQSFVAWTLRHGKLLWAIALLLAVPATMRTASLYLHLNSEIEALLPREAASVVALEELRGRMAGLQHLGVVVDTGAPEHLAAGEQLVDDLAARVRDYPPGLVLAIHTGDREERAFFEKYAPLYVELDDLERVRDRIEARREWEVSRATGTLLDEDEPPPALDFSDIEARYAAFRDKIDRFPTGRFSSARDHLTVMIIEVGSFSTGRTRGADLLDRVRRDIAELGGPERYAKGMRVGYAGDVAISVEETSALMSDLSISSVFVAIAVLAAIVVYFRFVRSTLILLLPLALAVVYAFALASLPPFGVTELNTNTAFLGSIIVGNGINVGVILLARYAEERRRGAGVPCSLSIAVGSVSGATFAAALAASVSYASLAFTEFRGFRQFGYVGGVGMVLSWVTFFLLMPSLTAWLDDGAPAIRRRPGPSPTAFIARAIAARPALFAAVAGALTVGAALQVRTFGPDDVESEFSRLRSRDTWTQGEGYWGRRMDDLLQTYLTPTVVLTDDPTEAASIARTIRMDAGSLPLRDLVAQVRTIDDVIPPDQLKKIEVIEDVRRKLTPALRRALPPDLRERVEPLLGRETPPPITASAVPDTLLAGLRERDGTIGRTVLVYPRQSEALWAGPVIASLVERLREAAAVGSGPTHRAGRVAGYLPLSADIYTSIRRDALRASVASFLGVVAVVLLLFRASVTSLLVMASLVTGLLWLAAGVLLLGIKINFANFIAFPITMGIGVDYALNVMSRHVKEGGDDPLIALRSTGGAVGLCSLTTILGYSSLVLANNLALHLFGLVAVLGEIACLAAALLILPSVLLAIKQRAARREARDAPKTG